MTRRRTGSCTAVAVLGLLLAALMLTLAACSGDDSDGVSDGDAHQDGDTPAAGGAEASAAHEDDDHDDGAAGAASAAQIALVMAAVDAADSIGFHGMAEDLDAATEVNSRLAGQVTNVLTAIRAAEWDETLEHGVTEFVVAVDALKDALSDSDLAASREAAHGVHEAQHHFTPAAYEWLAAQSTDAHSDANVLVTGLAAIDIVDSIGFHGMAEDLDAATEVNSRLAGKVNNALIVVKAAAWTHDMEGDVEAFVESLQALHEALEAGDLEAARTSAHGVHEAQHGFANGWWDWLAANHSSVDHSDPLVERACALKVIDMVSAAGLHGIAGDLEQATEVNSRLAGQIAKLVAVTDGDHYGPESAAGAEMHHSLAELQEALEAGDVESSHHAAVEAHELQHDLSNGMYGWIALAATATEDHDADAS